MRSNALVCIALLPLLVAPSVSAQSTNPVTARVAIGPFLGLNNTSAYGSDATDVSSRTDFAFGGQLDVGLSPDVLFRTGLIYSRRGFDAFDSGTSLSFKISYVEVPLLVGYRFPTGSNLRPYIMGGGQFGIKVGCLFEGRNGSASATVACEDPNIGGDFESTDFSVVGGAGIAMPVGLDRFVVDVRYAVGLMKIERNSEIKNRGFTFGMGLMIPVGN
ncbi:MAG TPA: porin family protein [Gemmatimonadaceae bacterium]|nr:porin family protein [Gemmatimonadaceae bacterium]